MLCFEIGGYGRNLTKNLVMNAKLKEVMHTAIKYYKKVLFSLSGYKLTQRKVNETILWRNRISMVFYLVLPHIWPSAIPNKITTKTLRLKHG